MKDKIANSIALHQMTIEEVREIRHNVKENMDKDVRFRIETKQMFRVWEEPYIGKVKDKLNVSTHTMLLVLDEVERKERERIDKLIDMEIEKRSNK